MTNNDTKLLDQINVIINRIASKGYKIYYSSYKTYIRKGNYGVLSIDWPYNESPYMVSVDKLLEHHRVIEERVSEAERS